MGLLAASKEIFSFFFRQGIRSKKARIFFLLSMVPVLILLLVKIIELTNADSQLSAEEIFSKILLVIYVQVLIPVLALFFSTMIVNEEVDNKTLVYLTSAPIPKPAIILGKFAAYILLSAIIVNAGLFLCFIIVSIDQPGNLDNVKTFLSFLGVGTLALISYSAFFTMASTWIKKVIALGLLFIFGWESVVQYYFPGVTQKFTFMHYIKSLLPYTQENVQFLTFRLEPSGTLEALSILILISVISLAAAGIIFTRKEYILSDSA